MTKQELMTYIAAILTTLAETNGSPESMLYIAVGMDYLKWETIRDMMLNAGWIVIRAHYVTLTPSGIETAGKINAAITSKN